MIITCKDHSTPYGAIDAHENAQLEADFNAPRCESCGELITEPSCFDNGYNWLYCSDNCFIRDNPGFVKNTINQISEMGFSYEQTIRIKTIISIFACCTEPTVNRWKRAIERRVHERDAILARAREMEYYEYQQFLFNDYH